MVALEGIAEQVRQIGWELIEAGQIGKGHILVIGVSTSEVLGQRIGTSGTEEAAAYIFQGIQDLQQQYGFYTAFQCCEHLNRALVVERELLHAYPSLNMNVVSAVPIRKAGGAMAAYAYRHFKEPCLVETIQAHAGIDIGETLIGMHLRPVAVPFRTSIRQLGAARVNAAYTRPKLIGGVRAVYTLD